VTTRARLVAALIALAAAASVVAATRSTAQVPPVTLPTLPPLTTTTAPSAPPSTAPPFTESTDVTEAVPDTTELPADTTVLTEVPPVLDTSGSSVPPPQVTTRPKTVALPSGLRPASVSGAYGIGFAGVLAVAFILVLLTTFTRAQLIPGGSPMTARRRARLIAGAACIAIAAIAGLVGYLKLSLETDVNRQIPYMASAGMVLVLLSAIGGALIVGEQMRTDEQRIDELEAAVQHLAAMVAPTVEAPARTKAASRKS
jgi:hypothetical protein